MNVSETLTAQEKIHNFFENPKGFWAWLVQVVIIILIFLSVYIFFIEFFYLEIFDRYANLYNNINHIILAVFTVEYLLRLYTSPKIGKFFIRPMNLVDFFAVFPNYLELFLNLAVDTTELRALRIIRILRFTRLFRAFKLFHYSSTLKNIFHYQNTILQSITPVIVAFAIIKGGIWALEHYGFWINNSSLSELFAIIGFALGIILSQKIGVSYGKFIQVEEAIIRIYGALSSLKLILNGVEDGLGNKIVKNWAAIFIQNLENPQTENLAIHTANAEMYLAVIKTEEKPGEMATMYTNICQDAALCLSKKSRLTPKAYDNLLQQATILYLTLTAIFIPGLTGLISVLVACYILYGMYHLTEDIDSILGGDYNLININLSELKYLIKD